MEKSLGSTIAEARKLRKHTQADLARHLGVTRGAVAQYEANATTPSLGVLKRICQFLQIDLGDAVEGNMTPFDTSKTATTNNLFAESSIETAEMLQKLSDYVETQVLFHPSPAQTLEWLARMAGVPKDS